MVSNRSQIGLEDAVVEVGSVDFFVMRVDDDVAGDVFGDFEGGVLPVEFVLAEIDVDGETADVILLRVRGVGIAPAHREAPDDAEWRFGIEVGRFGQRRGIGRRYEVALDALAVRMRGARTWGC